MKVNKTILSFFLFLVLFALPIAGRYALYYERPAGRQEVNRPDFQVIDVPTPPSQSYTDKAQTPGQGIVVVDLAHDNLFELPELNVLAARLASRGYQLREWAGDDIDQVLLEASSLIVAVPFQTFTTDQVKTIKEFVASGGRLLMMGDPTRFEAGYDDYYYSEVIESDVPYLNSLASAFGIAYVDDYLYNVAENEGNFRNIRLKDWGPEGKKAAVVDGLDMVVFFAAHSLSVAEDEAIIQADDQTWSSATDRPGNLVVAAQSANGRVVALGDMTFMTEPYHTVRDNGRFIAQIADFLMGEKRSFQLADFPLFFGSETLLFFPENPELGPGQLRLVNDLQTSFEDKDRTLTLVDEPDPEKDLLQASLFLESDSISEYLTGLGITLVLTTTDEITGSQVITGEVGLDEEIVPEDKEGNGAEEAPSEGVVLIDGIGEMDMSGTAMVVLDSSPGRQVLTVLAASQEGLENLLNQLPDLEDYGCVFSGNLALCPSGVQDEELENWEPEEAEPEAEEQETALQAPELPELEFEGELAYSETVTGELESGVDHLWKFEGNAGDQISIEVDTISGEMDLSLGLETLDGEELSFADENTSGGESISDYDLPETGAFAIRVSDFWGMGGVYTLSLQLLAPGGEEEGETTNSIAFGETVEGEVSQDGTAEWTFSGQAGQAVSIVLVPGDDGDLSLKLLDPAENILTTADSGMSGEEERIEGKLPADGRYTIRIEEYYGDEVSYTLSLESGGEGGVIGGEGILVVSADVGTPTLDGKTGADIFYQLLSPDYKVDVWTISTDGEISLEDMLDYQLVIWTSGDFLDTESFVIFDFLFESKPLILCGAYPAMSSAEETATLRDIQVNDNASKLTAGMEPGHVYELESEFDAIILEFAEDDGTVPVFNRGPASEQAGDVMVAGIEGDEFLSTRLLFFPIPYYLLPADVQELFIHNAMDWFGIAPMAGERAE